MTLKTTSLAGLFALGMLMPMHNACASSIDELLLALLGSTKRSEAPACPSPGDIHAAGPNFNYATGGWKGIYNVGAPSNSYGTDDRHWTLWIEGIDAESRDDAIKKANDYTGGFWRLSSNKAVDGFIEWACTYQVEGTVIAQAFSSVAKEPRTQPGYVDYTGSWAP